MYGKRFLFGRLKQDLGLLGFLACLFIILVLGFAAEEREQTESLVMFLVLFAPILFCAYRMHALAYTLAAFQTLVYTIYKLYQWSAYGSSITYISYLWILIPLAIVSALSLFSHEVEQAEVENELLRQQVEELVVIEPLTGLYNQRGLYTELERQMAYAKRNHIKLVLLEMRLKYKDELKRILTTRQFNHLRQTMARLVEDALRMEDRLYAIDQEGTLAILLNTDLAGAAVVERRLKERLMEKGAFQSVSERALIVETKVGCVEYAPDKIANALDFLRQVENELQYDV